MKNLRGFTLAEGAIYSNSKTDRKPNNLRQNVNSNASEICPPCGTRIADEERVAQILFPEWVGNGSAAAKGGYKKAAFTLAEVLITLGIIGVVAAMTIPNLVSNFQKKIWTAQLKRSHAVLNQGFRRMLADDDAAALSQTETFNSIGGDGIIRHCLFWKGKDHDTCKEFYRNLGKYFKISNIRDFTEDDKYQFISLNNADTEDYTGTVIILTDGTMIFRFDFNSGDNVTNNMMKGGVGEFYIDVNGTKRPNKLGRDIFGFHLGDNGIVYPDGSIAVSDYLFGNTTDAYWKTDNDCQLNSYGYSCAARVLEEGKMNY